MLLTGPPGSGKTHLVLERLRRGLAAGGCRARLIVPTSTMAEHLRHVLAREGLVFPSSLVTTLAGFAAEHRAVPSAVPAPVLDWLIAQALEELDLREYRRVAAFPGFRSALAKALEELSLAGCGPDVLGAWRDGQALAAVYEHVSRSARGRGVALSGERLSVAARGLRESAPGGTEFLFDGFFHFNAREMEVLEALKGCGGLTVTLPDWDGAGDSRARLLALGLREQGLGRVRPRPEVVLIQARTAEQEVEEIAARVAESRRPFREMGILLRTAEPYAPLVRAALGRFGIPARFYFAAALADHPRVQRWIPALSSAGSRRTAEEWREFCTAMTAAEAPRSSLEPATHRSAAIWRDRAAVARQWTALAGQTVELFGTRPEIPATEFRERMETAARLTTMTGDDRRRNVAHVMDAVEARQWELPVVYACGLLERQFPLYYSPDPVLRESLRLQLGRQGIRLQTAADWDRHEKLIFDIAVSRATEQLVLSYPECNEKGDATLPSFFLDRFLQTQTAEAQAARSVRPVPGGSRRVPPLLPIAEGPLRESLVRQHSRVSPTALEDFLQCPFLFFARHTLGLAADAEVLGPRLQGTVAHAVLARWIRSDEPVERLVNAVFREACEREGLSDNYRAEAIRLEILRNLSRFVKDARPAEGTRIQTERTLTLTLEDGVMVRCRIDRIDIAAGGRALIFDYKYSGPEHVRKIVRQHQEGIRMQGGLYLLALQGEGQAVAGMMFVALRNDQKLDGWPDNPAAVMETSLSAARRAVQEIRQGTILPRPADREQCGHCEFRDVCRVESAGAVQAAGGAAV